MTRYTVARITSGTVPTNPRGRNNYTLKELKVIIYSDTSLIWRSLAKLFLALYLGSSSPNIIRSYRINFNNNRIA